MKSIGEQFDVGLVKLQQYIDKDIEVGLRRFGDYIIEYAAKSKDPNNRTYNLQDSYGYAVYHDGKIAGMPVMLHNVADEPDTEGGWGTERGKRFLESYRPRVKGWSMAIVAGEFYASFLENEKNLDDTYTSNVSFSRFIYATFYKDVMIHKNYNPVKIRRALVEEVKRLGLSKNVFPQNRPKTYDKMQDFVVVKVSSGVRDNNAYGDTTCRIELYVKCAQNGIENETKMEKMTEKIEEFNTQIGPYHFFADSIIPMGSDDYGFSMSAVIIPAIIERVN